MLPFAAVLLVWLGTAATPAATAGPARSATSATAGRQIGAAHPYVDWLAPDRTSAERAGSAAPERSTQSLLTGCTATCPDAAVARTGRSGVHAAEDRAPSGARWSRAPPPVAALTGPAA